MPNWCGNDLSVSGPKEDMNRFIEQAKSKRPTGQEIEPNGNVIEKFEDVALSFEKFVPYPYGKWDYDWCVKNWGTKWDACEVNDDGHGNYYFDTAWSPPTEAVLGMSKCYPTLEFHLAYEECGCDFSGEYRVRNGEIMEDRNGPYIHTCEDCEKKDDTVKRIEGVDASLCPSCKELREEVEDELLGLEEK